MIRQLLIVALLAYLAPTAAAQVAVKVTKDHIDFLIGEELATRYHVAGFSKPILWPIYAPGKIPMTRSWPMDKSNPKEATDHPHQKSAYFCHGDVIPEGLELKQKIKGVDGVDFWSEATGHGDIICTKVGEPKTTRDSAALTTHNEWRTADGVKILDEDRTVSFHDFGKARLIVLDIRLLASTYPITFGDTKEGSLGIRINEQIIEGNPLKKTGKGKIQNAEGKVGELACWGQLSAWCDYAGAIDGKLAGLAILTDPKNTYPSCWHARGYGLMAANPFGRAKSKFPAMKGNTELARMAKGSALRLRYGILAHEGDADSGRVAELYDRFVKLRGD